MTAGYAAFQTNLNIAAKGNIMIKGIRPIELKQYIVNTGDGLYVDTTEVGRYIYKGSNPNNYITFNEESWRILSLDEKGNLKIVRSEYLNGIAWDEYNTRNNTTSTYCSNTTYPTCNAWAATSNLVGTPSTFTLYAPNGGATGATSMFSGTVRVDASLNTYLNNDYYNSLNETAKKAIELHIFAVGTPGNSTDTETLATDIAQEQLYQWKGKVGLINITEILRTSTGNSCNTLKASHCSNNTTGTCKNNNWLWTGNEFTISPYPNDDRYLVWNAGDGGCIYTGSTEAKYQSRPAVYLKSDIYLKGIGTKDNPFTINF
ncbi:MAG: hypothetical protein HFH45_01160 [Bacilli bacterium]|nr:hypothetical protein [Bacilli bacterium]